MSDSDAERLARLEREVAILRAEFARLRDHVGAPAASPRAEYKAPPSPPDSAPQAPRAASPAPPIFSEAPRRSFEEIIGRYGTIAVATLLALIMVGIFLNWAIRSGLLGPMGRVVVGYAAAAALAVGGMRLRARGTREYGNILMAIALGVVHLVCWSAGPLLHVIPSWMALGIGLLSSVMLAEFALRHDEEALCAIGFGGAAIAPFVAGDSHGSRIALAIYGVIIVALGSAALGDRSWKAARGVVIWSVIIYTIATATGIASQSPPEWISRRLGVITPLLMLATVIPFTHAAHRRSLIRVSAAALALGALLRADRYPADVWAMALTMIGTVVVIAALDFTRGGIAEREPEIPTLEQPLVDRDSLIDAFILPVALFLATIAATPDVVSLQSAAIALAFAGLAVWMTHRTRGAPEAGRYAATASLIALWIVPAAFFDRHLARVAGTAAMGVVMVVTALRMNRLPFIGGAFLAFTLASFWALLDSAALPRFAYVPFGTVETLAVAASLTGWVLGARIMAGPGFFPELDVRVRGSIREAFLTGAGATAFFWGVMELQGAWSQTAATALLVVYYAAAGALMIHIGRLRNVRHLRLIGLAVALWAAWKAIIEAFGIPSPGVKIAVFFAVSAFLLAVGYWYRRGAEVQPKAATPGPAA
jgi:hypothetical protein